MGEKRLVIPNRMKMRNLKQYQDMSEEEFSEVFAKKVLNVSPSMEFEKRIIKKLEEFQKDYDLDDLKINDMDTLRALVQAQIALEDYEQALYKERAKSVTLDNIVLVDKIQKVMSDLRSDISSFQNDLKITRKFRKSDQETSVINFIDNLKIKARKFSESRMSYIFCDKCHMLLATVWCLYPRESKNKLRFVCDRPTENGEVCGNVMNVGTKELLENSGSSDPTFNARRHEMNLRSLGNTGMQVSEIGLGCWQLANSVDWNTKESEQIVQKSLEAGCNFFDTAPGYSFGRSEELLGRILKPVRKDIIICSKFGYSPQEVLDFSTRLIRPSVEGSLRRLQTDYIDVLLFHSAPAELINGKTSSQYAELEKLKFEGKIRAYGVSVNTKAELETLLNVTNCQVAEIFFNAFCQESIPAFPHAQEKGVGLIAKVPLDSGWLAGIYNINSRFSGSRTRWSRENIYRRSVLVEKFMDIIRGIPIVHAALQFILSYPQISTVIPGAETVEQALDNISSANNKLDSNTIQNIQNLWSTEVKNNLLGW